MIACRLKHVDIVKRLLEELSIEDVNAVDNVCQSLIVILLQYHYVRCNYILYISM